MPHAARTDEITPQRVFTATPRRATTADRLLAEALRIAEHSSSASIDDRNAVAAVIAECPHSDFEGRILERAMRIPEAGPVREAIDATTSALRLALAAAGIMAIVAGGLAARAALRENTASVMALVFGLLGVQTVLLLAWMLVMIGGRRFGAGGSLGRAVMALGRLLARALSPATTGRFSHAAIGAMSLVHASGAAGRWTFSAISHGVWALFNAGVLLVLAALFLGEGYQFRWDSTWLSQESYGSLISALAAGPESLGFDVPDREQIESSRRATGSSAPSPQDAAAREGWSWFFFGSVLVYAFLPRVLLLGVALLLRRIALRRYRLDLERPGFALLRPRLVPEAEPVESASLAGGAKHASTETSDNRSAGALPQADRPARSPGPPAIVGLEMAAPATGWPGASIPRLNDLGIIDGRDDERRVLEQLSRAATSPNPLVIVVELKRSPDRGIERLVADLQQAAGGDAWLILTGGREMAKQHLPGAVDRRAADWKSLAARAGIDIARVSEIDLDLLTSDTRERLDSILNPKSADPSPSDGRRTRRIEEAFDEIRRSAETWRGRPTDSQRAALHLAISRIYGHESRRWGGRLADELIGCLAGKDGIDPRRALPALRSAAESVRNLLPPSLAAKSKWLAAGGLAGALGCIAVAATMAPVAFTALPMWSLVGAGFAAAVSGVSGGETSAAELSDEQIGRDAGDALRAAVLFALVLELQGRGEASISRILDRTLAAQPEVDASSLTVIATWLDEVRHRLDLALVEEQKEAARE